MSAAAMTFAKTLTAGGPARKVTLLCIADYIDEWGWAYPGQALIAEEAEVGIRSVRRYTSDLAKAGLIDIYRGRNGRGNIINLYRLVGFEPSPRGPMKHDHPSHNPTLSRVVRDNAGSEVDLTPAVEPPASAGLASGREGTSQRPERTIPPARAVAAITMEQNQHNGRGRARDPEAARPRSDRRTSPKGWTSGSIKAAQPPVPYDPAIGDEAGQAWVAARRQLRCDLGAATYRSWIAPLRLLAIEPNFRIEAPTRFHADHVNSRFGVRIAELLRDRLDCNRSVDWVAASASARR